MWYEKNYVRHLIDMHVADWNEKFLSEFDVENYVHALKLGGFQNAMIYMQSHVGLCNFPTKVGTMHRAFVGKEDTMRRLIDRCHEEGIAVTLYYSLNYNTLEHDNHEDFRALMESGMSMREGEMSEGTQNKELAFASFSFDRYGLCCPNSPSYRSFTYAQIAEMLDYAGDAEGVFFDMPYWNHTCYCENCQARYRAKYGDDLPKGCKMGDENYKRTAQMKAEWMGEWISSITDCVKRLRPNMTVEHNFSAAVSLDSSGGCAEDVAKACDFLGGDLYGGIYNHSFSCKFYKNITPNMPFDYMFSRCKPGLRYHTLSKTDDEIRTELFMNTAHNGASLIIDAIDPVGTMDFRFYERLGKIVAEEKRYEPYLGGTMVEDVGLYFGLMSKHSSDETPYTNKTSLLTLSENFIERHVPFGVTGNFHSLNSYRILIAPMISTLERDVDRIVEYVEQGGKLYFSGAENPELLYRLTGLRVTGKSEEWAIYIAPTVSDGFLYFNQKYPLPFEGHAPLVEMTKPVEVLATLTLPYTRPSDHHFAAIHSDPPGIPTDSPMIIRASLGKGEVIWSGVPIESIKHYEYKEIVMNLLNSFSGFDGYSFRSDAPETVELTMFDHGDRLRLNVIHVDERPIAREVTSFEVRLKTKRPPKRVVCLSNGREIHFTFDGSDVVFRVTDLKIYQMYQIELEA